MTHEIVGYRVRVAVLYQDRENFIRRKNTWREGTVSMMGRSTASCRLARRMQRWKTTESRAKR